MLVAVAAGVATAAQNRQSNEISLWYKLVKDYRQGRAEPAIDALVALGPGATKGLVSSEELGLPPEEMNAAAEPQRMGDRLDPLTLGAIAND